MKDKDFARVRKELADMIIDLQGTDIEFVSWGHFLVDIATGGGLPLGRMVELYGVEGVGKSTLAIQACAEAQKKGAKVVYVDTEAGFDRAYAENLGLDVSPSKLAVAEPTTAEEAFEAIHEFGRLKEVSVIVLDSVAGAQPQQIIDDPTAKLLGVHAQVVSRELRRVVQPLRQANTALILVNQVRSGFSQFNPTTMTTGGRALKYYSTMRIELRRTGGVKSDISTGVVLAKLSGTHIQLTVIKNKLASPFSQVDLTLQFGRGFDTVSSIISTMVSLGKIGRRGSFYEWDGQSYHGLAKLVEAIEQADKDKIIDDIKTTHKELSGHQGR